MDSDNDLDPRIQVELENLNAATDEINKLEIELEEANSTFRILMNESTRRLKVLTKKLGNCIEKARPYYDALEKAREAQIECQKAAVKFQRANEIHAAAKETVALAEQGFMSNSDEWEFDNAWQESLNCATLKVMDAESKKAECHAEHQRKAQIFNSAERKVQQLEEKFRRSIQRSRPYFEEKQICQDQLQTQKDRVMELQSMIQAAKSKYSTALRNLERISEDIHKQRGDLATAAPPGPREPGVGAEQLTIQLPDINFELEKCDLPSLSSEMSLMTPGSSVVSEKDIESELEDDGDDYTNNDQDLEELRQKVKTLAVRPVEGGDGQQQEHDVWENELNATVDKLDHLMMIKECEAMSSRIQQMHHPHHHNHSHKFMDTTTTNLKSKSPSDAISSSTVKPIKFDNLTSLSSSSTSNNNNNNNNNNNSNALVTSLPSTPDKKSTVKTSSIKKLTKIEPIRSSANVVSMRELPLLARISNEIWDKAGYLKQRRRSLD